MELQRTHFQAMNFYDFKSGLAQQQSHIRLKAAFGDEAPSRTTIYDWFAEFQRGRRSLEDIPRSGRPAAATTDLQVAAVQKLVDEDGRVTVLQIAEEVGISSGSVSNVLHNSLGLSKVSARWVPHMLTEEQKQRRVNWCRSMLEKFDGGKLNAVWEIVSGDETWVYCFDLETKQQSQQWIPVGQRPPQKFIRSRTIAKQMIAVFVSRAGHVATIPLVTQRTVTSTWYVRECLPLVLAAVAKRRPRTRHRGLLLHHDNAAAHRAAATQEFLHAERVHQLEHPPYSPDLAPCNFFVFPFVKSKLRGVRFDTPDLAVEAFLEHIEAIPQSEWASMFQKWFQRMQKCIDNAGEYFEKI